MLQPLAKSEFQEYLKAPDDPDSKYAEGVYDHLGAFCLIKTCEAYPNVNKGSARGGFRVMSRLIKFAAILYPGYVESEDITASTEDLRGILLQSVETPLRFADMSNKTNQEVEEYFGLTRSGTPSNLSELYNFEPNTSHGTLFIANDDHFDLAYSLGQRMDPEPRLDSARKCPMTELTNTIFWPTAVNLAADTPEVFAHSLGLEDN